MHFYFTLMLSIHYEASCHLNIDHHPLNFLKECSNIWILFHYHITFEEPIYMNALLVCFKNRMQSEEM